MKILRLTDQARRDERDGIYCACGLLWRVSGTTIWLRVLATGGDTQPITISAWNKRLSRTRRILEGRQFCLLANVSPPTTKVEDVTHFWPFAGCFRLPAFCHLFMLAAEGGAEQRPRCDAFDQRRDVYEDDRIGPIA